MSEQLNFAQELRKRRRELDISQPKLAKMVGVRQSVVSGYECGTGKPSFKILLLLAMCLRCTVDDLVCGEQVELPNRAEA